MNPSAGKHLAGGGKASPLAAATLAADGVGGRAALPPGARGMVPNRAMGYTGEMFPLSMDKRVRNDKAMLQTSATSATVGPNWSEETASAPPPRIKGVPPSDFRYGSQRERAMGAGDGNDVLCFILTMAVTGGKCSWGPLPSGWWHM